MDCVSIRHPGQVRRLRTQAGIQTTSPRRRGTRYRMMSLNFHWIPDLAREAALVRNDGVGEFLNMTQGLVADQHPGQVKQRQENGKGKKEHKGRQ
jgi:hypothetical protein